MMVVTTHGILRTEADANVLVPMRGLGVMQVDTWYLPFGYHTEEWISNKATYKRIFDESIMRIGGQDLKDFLPGNEVFREAILEPRVEADVWAQMQDKFGSCAECPTPHNPPDDLIINTWASGLMYHLTKYGDEPDYNAPGILDAEQGSDDEVAKLLREGEGT